MPMEEVSHFRQLKAGGAMLNITFQPLPLIKGAPEFNCRLRNVSVLIMWVFNVDQN